MVCVPEQYRKTPGLVGNLGLFLRCVFLFSHYINYQLGLIFIFSRFLKQNQVTLAFSLLVMLGFRAWTSSHFAKISWHPPSHLSWFWGQNPFLSLGYILPLCDRFFFVKPTSNGEHKFKLEAMWRINILLVDEPPASPSLPLNVSQKTSFKHVPSQPIRRDWTLSPVAILRFKGVLYTSCKDGSAPLNDFAGGFFGKHKKGCESWDFFWGVDVDTSKCQKCFF